MTCKQLISAMVAGLVWSAPAGETKSAAQPAKPAIRQIVNAGKGELEWRYGEQKLLVYAFGTNQFKPYVRELYPLGGGNVLRDAVPDHLHHHGLMYAIRINGVNFWEEKDAPGFEKPVKLLTHNVGRSAAGLPQAKFTQLIHWLAPTNRNAADSAASALLIEHRTLTLTVDEKAGEVALEWDANFEVCRATGKVQLHGSEYNGLGLRLPQSFDHVARFENSENTPYTGPNHRNILPAKWTSVTGKTDNGEIMLALFGRAGNRAGDTKFFTMLEPFAYLSATQGLDKQPLEYSVGDKFTLSYLLTVYSEPKSAEFLQRRYEAWNKSAK